MNAYVPLLTEGSLPFALELELILPYGTLTPEYVGRGALLRSILSAFHLSVMLADTYLPPKCISTLRSYKVSPNIRLVDYDPEYVLCFVVSMSDLSRLMN